MNSTEVSRVFQSAVTLTHRICGISSFVFNLVVCLLISFDTDSRGKAYRKYLFSLQFSSTMADACMNAYVPFVQSNCNTIYADSALAKVADIVTGMTIYFIFINSTTASYFLCVYYRRKNFLARDTLLSFNGRKYKVFLVAFLFCEILLQCAQSYIFSAFRYSGELPPPMLWLEEKSAFIYVPNNSRSDNVSEMSKIYVVAFTCTSSFLALCMIVQLIIEIRRERHGIKCASFATKRFKMRAVLSLVMQGVVPAIFLLIPFLSMSALVRYTMIVGDEVASANRTASAISVLSVSLMSFHAIAHSITVVSCSSAYRKTLSHHFQAACSRIRSFFCDKTTTATTTKVSLKRRNNSAFTSASPNCYQ